MVNQFRSDDLELLGKPWTADWQSYLPKPDAVVVQEEVLPESNPQAELLQSPAREEAEQREEYKQSPRKQSPLKQSP